MLKWTTVYAVGLRYDDVAPKNIFVDTVTDLSRQVE